MQARPHCQIAYLICQTRRIRPFRLLRECFGQAGHQASIAMDVAERDALQVQVRSLERQLAQVRKPGVALIKSLSLLMSRQSTVCRLADYRRREERSTLRRKVRYAGWLSYQVKPNSPQNAACLRSESLQNAFHAPAQDALTEAEECRHAALLREKRLAEELKQFQLDKQSLSEVTCMSPVA